MNQRPNRTISPPPARWLAPLAALATLALLLAWWQPWRTLGQPTPPDATVTPQAPTATRAPERIALPTERPRPTPPTPALAATPAALTTPVAAPTGSGTLLYLGTADGHTGIVAANADGSAPRLLVQGFFDQLAASPGGSRFAAIGTIPNGGGVQEVAIFDTTGRPLARYSFGLGTSHPLNWSPSGKYLLHTILISGRPETRVLSETEVQLITPPASNASFPYAWTPGDRIVYFVHEHSSQSRPLSLWTVDATGGDPQKHITGNFVPIGPNWDGTLFYALTPGDGPDPHAPLTELIAIDMRGGGITHVTNTDNLVAESLGTSAAPNAYRFNFVTLSPDGTHFAINLYRSTEFGTPIPPAEANTELIIFMHTSGRITGVVQVTADAYGPQIWAPDSSRFARFTFANQATTGQLQIFDPVGNRTAFPVERSYAGTFPQAAWSPDGTHLSYTSASGLMLITVTPHPAQLIAPGATSPAWQPHRSQP